MSVVDIHSRFLPPDQQDLDYAGELLSGLRLGDPQTDGPLKVLPLFMSRDEIDRHAAPPYITLRQAVAEGDFEVAEVSEAGSVTQLLFINKGDAFVLGLDGEQVTGLNQDRILATPVLVDKRSTLTVPVSCVERGRWDSQAALRFKDSEYMAERSVRLHVKRSTYASMRTGAGVRADQSGVWSAVDALHAKHESASRTRAMGDAFAARRDGLERILAAFSCAEGQVGILVLHESRVVGLDYVSQASQYAEVHPRLLHSYALEALVSGGEPGDAAVAAAFLERLASLQGEPFEAVGLGSDVRFAGDGIVGHALIYEGDVVHASFFESAADAHSDASLRHDRSEHRFSEAQGRPSRNASRIEDSRPADKANGVRRGPDRPGPAQSRLPGVPTEAMSRSDRAAVLAQYVRSLPGFEFTTFDVPYHHMGALLTDAVLQACGVRYFAQVVPRVDRVRQTYPHLRTTSEFAALLSVSDPHVVLDWGGATAVTRLLALTDLLVSEGVETEAELLDFLDRPGSRAKVTAISGVASKTYSYVRFLCGAEDAVAVDRHLWRHLAEAGIRADDFDDAVQIYRDAAAILGVSPATLEFSLFSRSAKRRRRP